MARRPASGARITDEVGRLRVVAVDRDGAAGQRRRGGRRRGLPLRRCRCVALRVPGAWYPVLDLAMTEFRGRDVGTSHAADRAARPDRRVPGPGQPPGPAELLPAGPDLPRARLVVVGAGGRARSSIHVAAIADGAVDRAPARRVARRGVRRRAARRRRARLRPGPADPTVEPVPAARGVDRRAARRVVGAVRRPLDARAARRRRHVLRPDPRARTLCCASACRASCPTWRRRRARRRARS